MNFTILPNKLTPKYALYIYISLILTYSNLYYWIDKTLPPDKGTIFHSIYFSVVTITTLGYGDISPASWWGMGLAASEAALGIIVIGLFLSSLWQRFTDQSEEIQKKHIENTIRTQNLKKLDGLVKYISSVSADFNQVAHEISTSPGERKAEEGSKKINIRNEFEIGRMVDIFEPSVYCERFSFEPVFLIYYKALDALCEELKLLITSVDLTEYHEEYEKILEFLTVSKNDDVRKSMIAISKNEKLKAMAIDCISRNRSLLKSMKENFGTDGATYDFDNPYLDPSRDDFDVAMTIEALYQSIKKQLKILNPLLTKLLTIYPLYKASGK